MEKNVSFWTLFFCFSYVSEVFIQFTFSEARTRTRNKINYDSLTLVYDVFFP